MQRVLIPVDGSRNSEFAVRHVIARFLKDPAMEVHLLNVQPPFSRHVAQFVSRRNREAWHRDEADKALAPARRLLEQHGVPHAAGYKLGERAKTIADEARRLRCSQIVIATARKNSLTRMLQDSTTNHVLEQTTVPVDGKYGEVLGVHMIGAHVTDMIHEAVVALKLEATLDYMVDTIHAHPTMSEAVLEAFEDAAGHAIHK